MAERRMFAKTIVLSDSFLDMPLSSRCLYFTLGMVADDDGFVNNPKSIMRQCGSSIDDLNLLFAKKFVIGFDNGVVVIKHWRIHNYIQKDRYIPSKYEEQKRMLSLDENNAYTLDESIVEEVAGVPMTDARQKRLNAYKESDLPYSFSYKIRNAFIGRECPICGVRMGVSCRSDDDCIVSLSPKPTIQHNLPISKGGKHELSNISVICAGCNASLQDNETGSLNNDLVVKEWERIGNVSGMYTQVSIGKDRDRLDKDSIDINTYSADKPAHNNQKSKFIKPSLDEISEYVIEKSYRVDAEQFFNYYESNGWKVGRNPMKSWKSALALWNSKEPKYKSSGNKNSTQSRLDSLMGL